MDAAVKSEYVETEVKIKEETSSVSYLSTEIEDKGVVISQKVEAIDFPFDSLETHNVKKEYNHEILLPTEEFEVDTETVCTVEEEDYCDEVNNTGNEHCKLIQTGNKSFLCIVCSREFNRKSSLRIHMFQHTGEKPFSCHACSRKFSDKRNLRQHQAIHTGKKSFSCDICLKSFSRGTHLRSHRIIHTGKKAFSCDVCKKRFTLSCSLRRHERIHKEERRFSCEDCTKTFVQRGGLKRHIIRIHT